MGGYNSGSNQPRSRYGLTEDTWPLDAMKLHRAGRLKPGSWGECRPGLTLTVKEDHVTLSYVARFQDGSNKAIGEPVSIVRSRRHFGGSVPYFLCPGEGCGRRVSKLYRSSGRYRCRHCSALKYACQYENVYGRTLRRLEKVGEQLEINPRDWTSEIKRPKMMRRKTYKKLVEKFNELDARFEN